MAYDRALAERVRALVARRPGVTEKAMFGGLAFLLDGKMFCGVLGEELLARVGADAHEAAVAQAHVRIMDFTGRPMRGYVFVGPGALPTKELERWVSQCLAHVAGLPEKPKKRPKALPRPNAKRHGSPDR
jgi:TfoX-like protein